MTYLAYHGQNGFCGFVANTWLREDFTEYLRQPRALFADPDATHYCRHRNQVARVRVRCSGREAEVVIKAFQSGLKSRLRSLFRPSKGQLAW